MRSYALPCEFTVEHETFSLCDFQAEGHFVCGLKDEHGFRREWEGDEVHVLTLRIIGETPLAGQQVLRVMADTHEEAERLMQRTVRETFFSQWLAQQTAQSNYQEFLALNEKRNQFQLWLNAQYAYEIETGKHLNLPTVFDVAVHYMRKERRNIIQRTLRALRRQKRIEAPEWVPQEWRQ